MFRLVTAAIAALALWAVIRIANDPLSGYAKRHMEAIVEALNQDLGQSNPACVYDVSFPRTVRTENESGYHSGMRDYRFKCIHCDELQEAGLIKTYATEMPRDGSAPTAYRYDLTDAGRTVYTEEREPLSGIGGPRFCFGTARVDKVVEALPEMPFGSAIAVSVKYTVRILEPHPFLFAPESASLGLPSLAPGTTGLPKPILTTLVLSPNGTVNYIDRSIRYGKWLNEK